jgi:hypothetical protein
MRLVDGVCGVVRVMVSGSSRDREFIESVNQESFKD